MRTTIDFNERLLKKLKIQAKEQSMTLSKYVEGLILMNSAPTKSIKKNKFKLITVKGELIDPAIDFDRPNGILTIDDKEVYKK